MPDFERTFGWDGEFILFDRRRGLSSEDAQGTGLMAVILPGERIGALRLGMSESQIVDLMGECSRRTEFQGTTLEHEMRIIAYLNAHLGRNDTIEDFPPTPPCVFLDYQAQGISIRLVHDYALSLFAFANMDPAYDLAPVRNIFTQSSEPKSFEPFHSITDLQVRYGEPDDVIDGTYAKPPNQTLIYHSGISFVVETDRGRLSRVVVTPAQGTIK